MHRADGLICRWTRVGVGLHADKPACGWACACGWTHLWTGACARRGKVSVYAAYASPYSTSKWCSLLPTMTRLCSGSPKFSDVADWAPRVSHTRYAGRERVQLRALSLGERTFSGRKDSISRSWDTACGMVIYRGGSYIFLPLPFFGHVRCAIPKQNNPTHLVRFSPLCSLTLISSNTSVCNPNHAFSRMRS